MRVRVAMANIKSIKPKTEDTENTSETHHKGGFGMDHDTQQNHNLLKALTCHTEPTCGRDRESETLRVCHGVDHVDVTNVKRWKERYDKA